MAAYRFSASLLALTALPLAIPATAQTSAAPPAAVGPRATPDADALADAMRRLASNPRDLDALVTAGELSIRLGDMSGAASLFARADKVDPMNARVKAGMGSLLVQEERPGAALRYFDQAVGYGLDPRRFAADRGLAYDLIGEQDRAQRDYRVALREASSDDLVRRYALSLGISGHKDQAFALLDPLLRKQDRSAWRARAFILAMAGDQAGADKIATSMMPGFASGLRPFFQRLPTLPAADRAFAVHFGEIRPTAERVADARLVPALAPLSPEAGAPTMLAANTAQPVAAAAVDPRRAQRRDDRRDRGRVATTTRAPSVAAATPVVTATQPTQLASNAVRPPVVVAPVTAQPVQLATVAPRPATPVTTVARPLAATVQPYLGTVQATPSSVAVRTASPVALSAVPNAVPVTALPQIAAVGASTTMPIATVPPAPSAPPTPVAVAAATPVATPAVVVTPTSTPIVAPAPGATPAITASTFVQPIPPNDPEPAVPTRTAARPAKLPRPPRSMNDSILARIVAGIEIPAAELAATPAAQPTPGRRTRRNTPVETAAVVETDTNAPKPGRRTRRGAVVETTAVGETDTATVEAPKSGRRTRRGAATAETAAVEDKAAPVDKVADRKATAAKKLADKKAADRKLADKAAADEAAAARKAERAQPSRIWVQVAGGANEGDLNKAWSAAKAKTPALAGKSGYATPLRATNRVLTGPFKTDAEARAFVNTLAKQGVSAFSFTSEAGQKITRLSPK